MSVRQYIGARYVPRFSTVNDGVWDNSYTYEALEIVKYGNDYYTSKKPVPTGVAITNTEYWVLTGNYNGAIGNLQEQIDDITQDVSDIEDTIEAMQNRFFIFIGDSYNTTDTPTGGTQIVPWGPLVAQMLGLEASQYISHGVSGAGWYATPTFLTQLQDVASQISDLSKVTDIVILGSVNDGDNYSAVGSNIGTLSTYVNDNMPNAKVYIGNPDWSKSATLRKQMATMEQWKMDRARSSRIVVIPKLYQAYHQYFTHQSDDHPTSAGSGMIALYVANVIKGGVLHAVATQTGHVSYDSSWNVTSGDMTFSDVLNGSYIDVTLNIPATILVSKSVSFETLMLLGTLTLNSIYATDPLYIGSTHAILFDGTTYLPVSATFAIQNGNQLYVRFNRYDHDATIGTVTHLITSDRAISKSFDIDIC